MDLKIMIFTRVDADENPTYHFEFRNYSAVKRNFPSFDVDRFFGDIEDLRIQTAQDFSPAMSGVYPLIYQICPNGAPALACVNPFSKILIPRWAREAWKNQWEPQFVRDVLAVFEEEESWLSESMT